jgi:hypothetical protein
LKKVDIIANGIPTMTPRQVIRIPLLSLIGRLEELQTREVTISVEYSDQSQGTVYTDSYSLGFKSLLERQLSSPPLHDISKGIEKIHKSIDSLAREARRR